MKNFSVVVSAAALAMIAGTASAGISESIDVTATWVNELGVQVSETCNVQIPDADSRGNIDNWTWTAGHTFTNGAQLRGLSLTIIADPEVNVGFNVASGFANTAFTINAPTLSFAPFSGATGKASAQIGITDVTGNGVTMTPASGIGFQARYNAGSNIFSNLQTTPLTAGAFASNNRYEEFGFAALGVQPVADITAGFTFTLSPLDLATGSGVFTVVPAPGSALLLGVAGLAAARRRR